MNASEMDMGFVEAIKSIFKDTTITISIKSEKDLTEQLNQHLPTKRQLNKAMTEARKGKTIAVSLNDLFNKIEQGTDFETFIAPFYCRGALPPAIKYSIGGPTR